MKVSAVAITQSLVPGINSAEELITYTARVSNPSNQMNMETSDKLIAFLIRKNHWSPFEQADLTVEIVTSRAIAAQILRHWSLRFQEFSQRYAEVVEFEDVELRRGNTNDRQSSSEVFDPMLEGFANDVKASTYLDAFLKETKGLYRALIKNGVAKECARMILPLTTQTTLFAKGNIRTWIFYLMQRTDAHAQLEHRMVADEVEKIFITFFPNIHKAIQDVKSKKAHLIEYLENELKFLQREDMSDEEQVSEITAHLRYLKEGY